MGNKYSRSFQRFDSRLQYIQQHSQMVYVSLAKLKQSLPDDRNKSICEVIKVSKTAYEQLNQPCSRHNRDRMIKYSVKKNNEQVIIEIFNAYAQYLKDILGEMYDVAPEHILEKSNKMMTFADIQKHLSMDDLKKTMIDEIFRELEKSKSTKKTLYRVIDHTGIRIHRNVLDHALAYLDMRHMIVHNEGNINKDYERNHGKLMKLIDSDEVPVTYQTTKDMHEHVRKMVDELDQSLVKGGYVR